MVFSHEHIQTNTVYALPAIKLPKAHSFSENVPWLEPRTWTTATCQKIEALDHSSMTPLKQ